MFTILFVCLNAELPTQLAAHHKANKVGILHRHYTARMGSCTLGHGFRSFYSTLAPVLTRAPHASSMNARIHPYNVMNRTIPRPTIRVINIMIRKKKEALLFGKAEKRGIRRECGFIHSTATTAAAEVGSAARTSTTYKHSVYSSEIRRSNLHTSIYHRCLSLPIESARRQPASGRRRK